MCQLFAISSPEAVESSELLREFFSHADEHPHGWGFADFSTESSAEGQAPDPGLLHSPERAAPDPAVLHSPERADTDPLAKQLLVGPLRLKTAMAHIRHATIGQVEMANCHPFTALDESGRTWTLAHKGTVFDHQPLDHYFYQQQGSTDSERVLLALIDRVNEGAARKGAPLEAKERFEVFTRLARETAIGNCVNLVVYDSDLLYVYRNYRAALHYLRLAAGGVVFSTEKLAGALPLAPAGASWKPVPLCVPLAYTQGKLVYRGDATGNQYFDNELDTRYLYWDFAGL